MSITLSMVYLKMARMFRFDPDTRAYGYCWVEYHSAEWMILVSCGWRTHYVE